MITDVKGSGNEKNGKRDPIDDGIALGLWW